MLVPTLPQALSIEESLLGALLMGTPYIHQVMQLSRDDDFYDQGLRNTFRAIVRLYNRGEEINAPLVYEELQRMLGPSEMYGDVLARILRSEASDHSALHMAQILQDYRQRRSMLTVGVRMQQWAAQMDQPLAESVEVLRRQFDGIMEGSTSTLTTLGQERQAVMQLVQDNLAGIKPPPGLMCGIRQLDDLGGLWDRGLVVVGAKSSHGKTMLMDLMALNVASQGRYVAYFSLEMGRDVVAARVMAMKSLVDGNRLRRKALAMVVIDYIQMLKITPATKDEVRAQTMDTDMHAFNKNSETGAVYAEEDIHMTYTGGMTFTLDKDPDAEIGYPDIDSDYDVEILGVSGRYDEFMYDGVTAVTKAALTQDGTITISKADGPNYTVALDSHTQTGKHLTASWTSPLAGYVWNYISATSQ